MKRADQKTFHYIYKITRTDGSGKYYIGLHSTDNLDDGYFGSGTYLWHSIKKHGKECHTKEILEFLPSRALVKSREKELVTKELLLDEHCMNLKAGGEGGWDFVNTNKLGSRAGVIWTTEARKKMSLVKTGTKPKLSEERRREMTEENVAKRPEVRTKISAALAGKKHSDEHKANLSKAASANWAARLVEGRKTTKTLSTGRKPRGPASEETKEKIRQAALSAWDKRR